MKRGGRRNPREESGARKDVFIVVVGVGSQWWTPRAFLDIFAFLVVDFDRGGGGCRDETEPEFAAAIVARGLGASSFCDRGGKIGQHL